MKTVWLTKIWPWMKQYWVMVLNPVVIAIAYNTVFDKGFTGIEVLLALTLLCNVGYWGYKIFSGDPKKV